MTAGIEVITGSNADTKLTITDQDIPPGLWLDSFDVAYGATVTKTYSPGIGSKLLVQAYSQNPNVSTIVKMTITGMTLVVSNSKAALGSVAVTIVVMVSFLIVLGVLLLVISFGYLVFSKLRDSKEVVRI